MMLELAVLVAVFWGLVATAVADAAKRHALLSRSRADWLLDLAGLTIHGMIVPLFQTLVVAGALGLAFPEARGSLRLPPAAAFLLNFVGVDYLYYWNHRALHTARLWRFHALHHSGGTFDVFTTSRNSALTTWLIAYVWVNGLFLYLLEDPFPYVVAVVASNALDLLRHGRLSWWPRGWLAGLLVSPRDHAWHHSRDAHGVNFGANFSLWDKLHGTYRKSDALPERFGAPVADGSARVLWRAFWRGLP